MDIGVVADFLRGEQEENLPPAASWLHYKRATFPTMKSCTLPAVRVEPELRAELEAVLGEEETISTFVVDAVRRAVDFRRVQTDFHARGEAAWQDYLRSGVSHPVDEVFDRVQARIDARRRELQSPST
ncbi:YlcI/YnfO family protein [Variovorax saccharolyticus]|uniref:YlcI/YnfO family protein n=2 Tax=Variovorax saccharolyticus TaxID=3053516 RepID=UPI002576D001|nr:YlcI/YnfO family protein [Variovorax sp. J31P216]MDM0026232.1 YlcI/YnfO family protein [Variovorax sp. J31P216]